MNGIKSVIHGHPHIRKPSRAPATGHAENSNDIPSSFQVQFPICCHAGEKSKSKQQIMEHILKLLDASIIIIQKIFMVLKYS